MRYVLLIAALIGLSACATTPETRTVITAVSVQTPGVVIPTLAPLVLLPVNLDAPRNMKTKVANPDYADCMTTPPESMDVATANRCLLNPIDYAQSNLYRGFDRASFKNYQINQVRVDARIKTLESLISSHNEKVLVDNERIRQENAAQPKPTPSP